jgi:hypothetical protein
MATAPAYAVTPLIGTALITNSTADTSFSTPTHATLVLTGGASGTKITQIDVLPAGTISSGGVVVNIFLYNGTTYYLHESILVAAITPATQVPSVKYSYTYDNLVIPSGWYVYATETVVTQPCQVSVYGASL